VQLLIFSKPLFSLTGREKTDCIEKSEEITCSTLLIEATFVKRMNANNDNHQNHVADFRGKKLFYSEFNYIFKIKSACSVGWSDIKKFATSVNIQQE
jgi:hypothetical protein